MDVHAIIGRDIFFALANRIPYKFFFGGLYFNAVFKKTTEDLDLIGTKKPCFRLDECVSAEGGHLIYSSIGLHSDRRDY